MGGKTLDQVDGVEVVGRESLAESAVLLDKRMGVSFSFDRRFQAMT